MSIFVVNSFMIKMLRSLSDWTISGYNAAISACENAEHWEEAINLLEILRRCHGVSIKEKQFLTHKKLGHISCWYFRLFTLIKKSVFWWLVKWLTCVSNEWRAHFTNNLLEDDEHRILCELSGVSNVSLCGTRVVTLGVNPSQEGVACLTVDLNLSLHSPMLQRDRERISKFWLTVWISIISI